MQRPPRMNRADPKAIDESTDAYDSIEWLLKNVPNNNGRVGMTGVSYDGWTTAMAMLDPHPALKAGSPQASPADMWMGDDFHHNGAFRLSYGFEYATMMESGKDVKQFTMDAHDTYEWYLKLGSLKTVNEKFLKGTIPTWNDFAQHPNFDAFWQRQAMAGYLDKVTVPALHVAGWWDQEDFYGPVTIYRELETHDRENKNFLVVGPWNHGGWMGGEGASLGPIQFGQPTARFFRDSIMAPFFARHLHPEQRNVAGWTLPEALVFEAGSNVWKRYETWPPKTAVSPRSLYMREGGALAWEPPATTAPACDAYVSDPAKQGHRVMIQVQSTWFPLIDRNPQTFVSNIFEAKPSGFRYVIRELFSTATVVVFGIPLAFYVFYRIATIFFTYFTHANINVPAWIDRPLSWVFVTPNMHKFHHHMELPWTDTNFGNVFSFWDRLMGTMVNGDPRQVRYGVDTLEGSPAESIVYQLKVPLQGRRM